MPMALKLNHPALRSAAAVLLAAPAIAQVGPQPIAPVPSAVDSAIAESARRLDAGVEDTHSLQVSLLHQPPDLRQDNNFEHVYRADDGRLYRRAGATVAIFLGSEYANYRGQQLPLIPAGTVFHPCGFPSASCGGDLARSLAQRPISCVDPRGAGYALGTPCGGTSHANQLPCGAGNALSGGYARGELLGPIERHDLRCVNDQFAGAEPATQFATQRVTNRAAPATAGAGRERAPTSTTLDRVTLIRADTESQRQTQPATTEAAAAEPVPDRAASRHAEAQEAERIARLQRLAQQLINPSK